MIVLRIIFFMMGLFVFLTPLWVYLNPSPLVGTDGQFHNMLRITIGPIVGTIAMFMATSGDGPRGMYD